MEGACRRGISKREGKVIRKAMVKGGRASPEEADEILKDSASMFYVDRKTGDFTAITLKKDILSNEYSLTEKVLFKKKQCVDIHQVTLVQLFSKKKETQIVAFGLKPSGKFYHFKQGKPYDTIEGADECQLGDLKYHSVMVIGRSSPKLLITGGI